MSSNFSKFLFIYGSALITFSLSLFCVSWLSLLFRQEISSFSFVVSTILTLIFVLWSTKAYFPKNQLLVTAGVMLAGLISGAISVLIARQFYDLSYDGQAYHGEAIVELINGEWNPFVSRASGYNKLHGMWLDAYPKASWFDAVSLFRITNNYEDTKAFNIFFGFASVAYSIVALSFFKLNNFFKSILVFLATFNPLFVLQYNGLLLDGQLSSLLWILFCFFMIAFHKFDKVIWVSLFAFIILLINVKTAGLIYFIISSVCFLIILNLRRREDLSKIFLPIILGFLVAVTIFGFNPYLTNTNAHKNPVFPSLDKKAFDFTENTPKNYRGKSNIEIFVSSIFFATDRDFSEKNSEGAVIKNPLSISANEIDSLRVGAIKKGGFGPLFAASFLAVLLPLLLIAIKSLKGFKLKKIVWFDHDTEKWHFDIKTGHIYIIFTLFVFGSCIMTSTSNTFRYIPQFWLWCVVSLGYIFTYQKSWIFKVLGLLAAAVMICNIAVTFYYNTTKQLEYSAETKTKLQAMAQKSVDNPIDVNIGVGTANRLRLKEAGVNFIDSPKPLTCKSVGAWAVLPENPMNACLDN